MAPQFVWSNDLVLEFIQLYRKEELLWDSNNPHHKNRTDCAQAWNRIKKSLSEDIKIADLKKKKESLMTTFRLHSYRIRKFPKYQTCWFAYSAMDHFLGAQYEFENDKDSSNYLKKENHSKKSNQSSLSVIKYNKSKETDNKETELMPAGDVLDENPENNIALCMPKKFTRSSNKKRTLTLTLQEDDNCDTDLIPANKRDNNGSTDEYELYGQLLAKKLKKLDERQRDIAMHEIDIIMYRIKTQLETEYSEKNHNSESPPPLTIESSVCNVNEQNFNEYEKKTYQDREQNHNEYENMTYQDHEQNYNEYENMTYQDREQNYNEYENMTYQDREQNSNEYENMTYQDREQNSNEYETMTYQDREQNSNEYENMTYQDLG